MQKAKSVIKNRAGHVFLKFDQISEKFFFFQF